MDGWGFGHNLETIGTDLPGRLRLRRKSRSYDFIWTTGLSNFLYCFGINFGSFGRDKRVVLQRQREQRQCLRSPMICRLH
mmetsp:Transcript_36143/g.77078  ORF Transcript_36143/g.77078 Transcript_36143/m.77078 type:complete len:80 (-) Transcript_36143:17-256(-)